MNLLLVLIGLLGGFAVGCLFVHRDSQSSLRTEKLINHIPHLPYFALFYFSAAILAYIADFPVEIKVIFTGMVAVECTMYFLGKRLAKKLGK